MSRRRRKIADKKSKRTVMMCGRPGGILMGWWKLLLEQKESLLSTGTARKTVKVNKIKKTIKGLHYNIDDHELFHPRRREYAARIETFKKAYGYPPSEKQAKEIQQQVFRDIRRKH